MYKKGYLGDSMDLLWRKSTIWQFEGNLNSGHPARQLSWFQGLILSVLSQVQVFDVTNLYKLLYPLMPA